MKYLKDVCAEHGHKPTGILHVGASMLEEADQYTEMGVKTVIWVEAQPPSERRRTRATQFGHALYEGVAFSDKNEEVMLNVTSNEVSSSILALQRHSAIYPDVFVKEQIPTMAVKGEPFLRSAGFPAEIDTLVLDVQGAELKVLKGLGSLLDQIKFGWLEVNLKPLYTDCVLQPELDKWMYDHGFVHNEFQMIHEPEWGEACYWK